VCDDARARAFGRVAAICPRACVARAYVERRSARRELCGRRVVRYLGKPTLRLACRGFSSLQYPQRGTTSARPAIMPAKGPCTGKPLIEWCAENGERGDKLLEEYCDPDEGAAEVAKGSNYRALWKCSSEGCGHEWRAQVGSRTRGERTIGCPKCTRGYQNKVTPTDNFLAWCAQNGRRGAELLREYRDPKKLPDEVKKASTYKALWKCAKCKHRWRKMMYIRTKRVRPTGCPQCSLAVRKKHRKQE